MFLASSAVGTTHRQLKDCNELIVDLDEKFSFFLKRKLISQFHLDFLFNFCQLDQ